MPTLDWIGKNKVVNHHLDVPYCVLNVLQIFIMLCQRKQLMKRL